MLFRAHKLKKLSLRFLKIYSQLPLTMAVFDKFGKIFFINSKFDKNSYENSIMEVPEGIGKMYLDAALSIADENEDVKIEYDYRKHRRLGIIKKLPNKIWNQPVFLGITFDVTDVYTSKQSIKRLIHQEKFINGALQMVALNERHEKIVRLILNNLKETLASDRVFVYKFDRESQKIVHIEDWDIGDVKFQNLPKLKFSTEMDIFRDLEKKRVVFSSDLKKTCPRALEPYIDALRSYKVDLIMIVGMWHGENLVGALGVDYVGRTHKFNPIDSKLLGSAARVICISKEREDFITDLEKSQNARQTLLDSLSIPSILFDADMRIIISNSAAKGMVQYVPKVMLTDNCPCVLKLEKCMKMDCIFKKCLASAKEQSAELEIGGKWQKVSCKPILTKAGVIQNILCTLVDMTEAHRREMEMQKAIKAEQSANSAKGIFIATISHEVRTPINAIIGLSEISKDANISGQARLQNLDNIKAAAESLLSVLNDVLDISSLESGTMKFVSEPTDIEEILYSILSMFNYEIVRKGLQKEIEVDKNIPLLYLDSKRLRQIVVNLFGNAVKFTKAGKVGISAQYSNNTLKISVKDTGCGIDADYIESIFRPFEQQPHLLIREQRLEGGAGIGLSISKKLAENMGGEIFVKSEIGMGSVFTVEIKNIREAETQKISSRDKCSAFSADKTKKREFKKVAKSKIMIVDDIEMNLKVLGALVKNSVLKWRFVRVQPRRFQSWIPKNLR